MKREPSQTFVRDLKVLYQAGTVGGLTDRELLSHFTTRDSGAAQQAFEAIVHRHGPMVLGACRRALGDEHEAEDAFQATFLVLALKADTIRSPNSLGPWLHGVATRLSRRARVLADRRGEQALAPGTLALCVPEGSEIEAAELRSALDEEIDRLPAAFRRAIVLCYLEGKTQEDAARELGWTKGTVSGRLARAKDLLRARLSRRGFAPPAGLVAAMLAGEHAKAAVPPALSDGAVRTALSVALGRGEMIASGPAVALARGALRAMLMGKVTAMGVAALMLATLAAALVHAGVGGPEPPAQAGREGDRPTHQGQPAAAIEASRTAGPRLHGHARARLGTTRLRHQGAVSNVVFAPNGRTLASTGRDGTVRFWDVATGEPAADLPAIKEPGPWRGSLAESLAYSPDGTTLAIGHHDGLVQLWDVVAGRERSRNRAHKGRLYLMAFAPDGRTFATASDEHFLVRIWDVATGRERRTLTYSEETHYRGSLALSPDGKYVAFGATLSKTREPVICVWDLGGDAGPVVIRKPHDSLNFGLAFAPGDTLMTSGEAIADVRDAGGKGRRQASTPQIRTWDARSGQKLKDFGTGLIGGLSSAWLTLSRDGKTMVTSHDDRLLVWDLGSEKIVRTIPVNDAWCSDISPDGRTLAGARGHSIYLWDTATRRSPVGPGKSHDFAVTAAMAPDGRLAATIDETGMICIWDPARSEVVHTLDLGRRIRIGWGGAFTVRFSPDGRYLAASGEDHDAETSHRIAVVRLWDVPGFRVLLDEQRTDRDATSLEFSPDGRRAAVVLSKLGSLPWMTGKTLEPKDDDVIELFDVATGEKSRTLRGHRRAIKAIAFAPDGKGLVSAGEDKDLRFWDLASGAMTRIIPIEGHRTSPHMDQPGAPTEIVAIAFSPDLATAVTGGAFDDQLLVWDMGTGRLRRTFSVPAYRAAALAISPDGRLLAAAMSPIRGAKISVKFPERLMEILETEIVVWDIATKRERLRLEPRVWGVWSLAFAADGKTLISGMSDTTALIWDISAAYDAPRRPQD